MKFSNYLRLAVVGLGALDSCKSGPPTAAKPGKYCSTTSVEYNNENGMTVVS